MCMFRDSYFFGKKLIIYIYYNSKLLYFSITNIIRSVMNYYTKNLFHPQIHNTCGATLTHFISSPWPMPRRKKCPRTNKESLDCQDILPRTTLSSANRDHEMGKCHATKGSLLERPKGKPKCSGPAIGAWWEVILEKVVTSALNTHN